MEQIIEMLEISSSKYPERVKLYSAVKKDTLERTENMFKISLDKVYSDLLLYSNGFSIVDYCLIGFGNSEIADFTDTNMEAINLNNERQFTFLGTSSGEEFYFIVKDQGYEIFYDDGTKNPLLIGSSFTDFFIKFLTKTVVLLEKILKTDVVAYFDDDNMPDSLQRWN